MDKIQLYNLIESGCSTYKIAEITGKSQTTIRYWLKKYELKTKKKYCCQFCGETRENEFMNKGGGKRSFTLCKKCHNLKSIERFRENKKRAVDYKGGKCQKCGYNKSLRSLQFHHRDPNKKDIKFNANWVKQWEFDKVKKELDKCDLLCSNCHGETHDMMEGD